MNQYSYNLCAYKLKIKRYGKFLHEKLKAFLGNLNARRCTNIIHQRKLNENLWPKVNVHFITNRLNCVGDDGERSKVFELLAIAIKFVYKLCVRPHFITK